MRISDWSSDVCSSDLVDYAARGETGHNYYSVRGELIVALPYATLRERSVSVAKRLVGLGLPRGARVGLVADTSPAFHSFFFGCQYAGLIPVPLPLPVNRSEEHTSELQSLMRTSYAVFCLKKK